MLEVNAWLKYLVDVKNLSFEQIRQAQVQTHKIHFRFRSVSLQIQYKYVALTITIPHVSVEYVQNEGKEVPKCCNGNPPTPEAASNKVSVWGHFIGQNFLCKAPQTIFDLIVHIKCENCIQIE